MSRNGRGRTILEAQGQQEAEVIDKQQPQPSVKAPRHEAEKGKEQCHLPGPPSPQTATKGAQSTREALKEWEEFDHDTFFASRRWGAMRL